MQLLLLLKPRVEVAIAVNGGRSVRCKQKHDEEEELLILNPIYVKQLLLHSITTTSSKSLNSLIQANHTCSAILGCFGFLDCVVHPTACGPHHLAQMQMSKVQITLLSHSRLSYTIQQPLTFQIQLPMNKIKLIANDY